MIKRIPRAILPTASPAASGRSAFTTVELLASMALLAGVMVLLVSTVDQTQRVWKRTSEKATQFQAARAAFEAMNRRLSQATLNTYWRAFETDLEGEQANFRYRRQSELQFLSGPTTRIIGAAPIIQNVSQPVETAYPTHSVFFQAPLGYTEEMPTGSTNDRLRFETLDSLMVGCGYFVEYGPEPDRPEFLRNVPSIADRYRFRLMEMTVPAERLNIYKRVTDTNGYIDPRIFDENGSFPYVGLVDKNRSPVSNWVRPFWMRDALLREPVPGGGDGHRFRFARPRAENIIGLIVLPKLAEKDRQHANEPELAPFYEYDSWRVLIQGQGSVRDGNTVVKVDNVGRDNLLPPIVQITMIAVDEPSMARLDLTQDNAPEWTKDLFKKARYEQDYQDDLKTLETRLQEAKLNYRVFSTDVVIRASKWSRDPFTTQAPSK